MPTLSEGSRSPAPPHSPPATPFIVALADSHLPGTGAPCLEEGHGTWEARTRLQIFECFIRVPAYNNDLVAKAPFPSFKY